VSVTTATRRTLAFLFSSWSCRTFHRFK